MEEWCQCIIIIITVTVILGKMKFDKMKMFTNWKCLLQLQSFKKQLVAFLDIAVIFTLYHFKFVEVQIKNLKIKIMTFS